MALDEFAEGPLVALGDASHQGHVHFIAAGLDPVTDQPKTLDQLREVAEKIKAANIPGVTEPLVMLTIETDLPVYFCDPRSPWQRGSNENTNGLLRQYFPKRSDLSPFDQAALDQVAAELNGRPRQTLGWMTPSQALDQVLR